MAANPNAVTILNQNTAEFALSNRLVAAGGVGTIVRGTPTKLADAFNANPWTGAIVPMVTSDGTTTQIFAGIAKNTSTDTASVAGGVDVYLPLPGLVYACKAKTASTANTAALVQALVGLSCTFDLTSSTWTVNADNTAGNDKTRCLVIVGGNPNTSTVYFVYAPKGTFLDYTISA